MLFRRGNEKIVDKIKQRFEEHGWAFLLPEGPIRRTLRLMLGKALGVPGSKHPFRDWFRREILGLTSEYSESTTQEQNIEQQQQQ